MCVSEWEISVTRPNLHFFNTYRHKSPLLSHPQYTWSSYFELLKNPGDWQRRVDGGVLQWHRFTDCHIQKSAMKNLQVFPSAIFRQVLCFHFQWTNNVYHWCPRNCHSFMMILVSSKCFSDFGEERRCGSGQTSCLIARPGWSHNHCIATKNWIY